LKKILLAVSAAMLVSVAVAHHSAAMFDHSKIVTYTGVVKEFQYTNPHSWLQVLITGPDGKTVEWGFEAEGPSSLKRIGIEAKTFKPGDKVRAKNINPLTHTRLPRYVRGHVGTIERVVGCHVFPDSNATGAGEDPQWLYTVRFDGRELWGANGDPTVKVSIDAWEPYLESA